MYSWEKIYIWTPTVGFGHHQSCFSPILHRFWSRLVEFIVLVFYRSLIDEKTFLMKLLLSWSDPAYPTRWTQPQWLRHPCLRHSECPYIVQGLWNLLSFILSFIPVISRIPTHPLPYLCSVVFVLLRKLGFVGHHIAWHIRVPFYLFIFPLLSSPFFNHLSIFPLSFLSSLRSHH